MKREMTVCDNSECESVTDEGYGWIRASVSWIGTGPVDLKVEVCDLSCLEQGVEDARDRSFYEEHRRTEERAEELKQAILSVPCEVCDAQPGRVCYTSQGNPKQDPHASRREAGRKLLSHAPDGRNVGARSNSSQVEQTKGGEYADT